MAAKDCPSWPKCGCSQWCGATVDTARLRAENEQLKKWIKSDNERALKEIEHLKAEVQDWRECAVYNVMMEGPRFQTWNRSALDRCRKKYCEER